MRKESMSPRERWEAVLNHKKPDRIPMDYSATPEVTEAILRYTGTHDLDAFFEKMHIDHPVSIGPAYAGPPLPENTNYFGAGMRDMAYATGVYREFVSFPLSGFSTIDEIESRYTFPTADWFDFSTLRKQVDGKSHRPITLAGTHYFIDYMRLRGEERAYMDVVEHPDIVAYCHSRLCDFYGEMTRRSFEALPAGTITMVTFGEDMGSEIDLLISRAHFRELIWPYLKCVGDLVHECGAKVYVHSDGAIGKIIPDFIEMGADILDPVQWRLPGMDLAELKALYGGRLAFHGAVDNQRTMPFGSAEDVREEVRRNIAILKEDYILGPCHAIQPVSPPENTIALYDEGWSSGWF
jgi:uroporphyrinogen decarboxylase